MLCLSTLRMFCLCVAAKASVAVYWHTRVLSHWPSCVDLCMSLIYDLHNCDSPVQCRRSNCNHCLTAEPSSSLGRLQLHHCGVGSIQWHDHHCIDHQQSSLQEAVPYLLVRVPKACLWAVMALVLLFAHRLGPFFEARVMGAVLICTAVL